MTKLWVQFAITFYNFFAIFNLNFKGGKCEVSNILSVLNLFETPGIIALHLYTHFYVRNRSHEVMTINHSNFFTILSIVFATVFKLHAVLFCWIQVANRNKVEKLVNKILGTTISEENFLKCRKSCVWQMVEIIFLYSASLFYHYFILMEHSFVSFILFVVSSYVTSLRLVFVNFVRNFECFIVALMNEFELELENFSHQNYKKYFKRYQEIYDLTEEFQNCFGLQLTISICVCMLECIFSVSTYIDN